MMTHCTPRRAACWRHTPTRRLPAVTLVVVVVLAVTAAVVPTPAAAAQGRCAAGDTALTDIGCRTTCATGFLSCTRFSRGRSCRSWFFKSTCCRDESGPSFPCANVGITLRQCYCERGGLRTAGIVLLVLAGLVLLAAVAAVAAVARKQSKARKIREQVNAMEATDGTAPGTYVPPPTEAQMGGAYPTTAYPTAPLTEAPAYPVAHAPAMAAYQDATGGGYPPQGAYGGAPVYNTGPTR
ncbi:hypothetical protein MMPV_001188 [Pyropia vietnamensis]